MVDAGLLSAMVGVALQKGRRISEVLGLEEVSGGCINSTFKVKTNGGSFFVKANSAKKFPGMFEAEARGLNIMADAGEIEVPEVVGFSSNGEISFLVLAFMDSGEKKSDFWKNFARGIAGLHKKFSNRFGLDHDNYIGMLPQ